MLFLFKHHDSFSILSDILQNITFNHWVLFQLRMYLCLAQCVFVGCLGWFHISISSCISFCAVFHEARDFVCFDHKYSRCRISFVIIQYFQFNGQMFFNMFYWLLTYNISSYIYWFEFSWWIPSYLGYLSICFIFSLLLCNNSLKFLDYTCKYFSQNFICRSFLFLIKNEVLVF